jgi:hypothetical protein
MNESAATMFTKSRFKGRYSRLISGVLQNFGFWIFEGPAATTASRFCFMPSGGAALSAHSPRRAPFGCPAVGYPLQSLPEIHNLKIR